VGAVCIWHFFCVCGVLDDFGCGVYDFLFFLIFSVLFLLEIFDLVCLMNRIAYLRLRGIALVDVFDVLFGSVSGVVARGCGLLWDCRLFCSYEIYCIICFNYVFCVVGDAFDRFVARLFDMRNALFVVKQCFVYYLFFGLFVYCMLGLDLVIETIIYLFYMCWCCCLPGIALSCVEHPKGEYFCVLSLFIFVCSRCRIRCADYISILGVDLLVRGFLLSDLCALIGNVDVVFGSVDR